MAGHEKYGRYARIASKQAHRTSYAERRDLENFLIQEVRKRKERYQHFFTNLTVQAVIHKDRIAGRIYNARKEIEEALALFASRGDPIRSALRPLAINYIVRWEEMAEEEVIQYELDRLVEKQMAHMLGHRKPKRRVRKHNQKKEKAHGNRS